MILFRKLSFFNNFRSKNESKTTTTQIPNLNYHFKISKLKALRKMNQSVESIKLKPSANEYGYCLPRIESNRFKSPRGSEGATREDISLKIR